MDKKNLLKALEQDEAGIVFAAGTTLVSTCVMVVDVTVKTATTLPSLPAPAVMFLATLTLAGAGAMTVCYAARQSTVRKIREQVEAETQQAIVQESASATKEGTPTTA
jgi:hypothetical protein